MTPTTFIIRCWKCDRDVDWENDLLNRPPCPYCGAEPDQDWKVWAQKKMQEREKQGAMK